MTIWTDLLAAIEAEAIDLGYTGTLTEVGIDQPYLAKLITLLDLRAKLVLGTGGGGVADFTNSPINLGSANAATLKASAGAVYKVYCYNKNAATRFFQIHNKATAPVNTDVPVEVFPVAANSALLIDIAFWGATGRTCSTGVSWAFSTTEATLTLGTAADVTSSVGYL